jgi:hypothetical protein
MQVTHHLIKYLDIIILLFNKFMFNWHPYWWLHLSLTAVSHAFTP